MARFGPSTKLEEVHPFADALAKVLAQLVQDEDQYVRQSVARNPNTPVEILHQLSQDTVMNVRVDATNMLNKRRYGDAVYERVLRRLLKV